jgi:intein/homing endonuclease
MAEFLGFMVADGTVYKKGFRLAKRHLDVADRFDGLCRSLFEVTPRRFVASNAYHVEVNSRQISDWLLSIGGVAPHEKYVPDPILRSSLEVQASFLRGFFEDGAVNVRNGGILDHIEVFTSFKEISRVVRVMLLRFGVISGIVRKRGYSAICVYGANASRLAEVTGFISSFKNRRLQLPAGKETRYLVPVLRAEVEAVLDVNGGRGVLTYADKNAFTRGVIPRHQLQDFLNRMSVRNDAWCQLGNRLDFHHSKVRSITPYEGESMCVEVPDGHRFIQDGFCGWNSQGSEFDTVVMPIVKSQGRMLQRNLFYTAVTRAKKKVWLLGEASAVAKAIANDKVVQRNTGFERAITHAMRERAAGVEKPDERLEPATGVGQEAEPVRPADTGAA